MIEKIEVQITCLGSELKQNTQDIKSLKKKIKDIVIDTIKWITINLAPKFFVKIQNIELSVLITDDENIRRYNKQYRDKDKTTNVLSFPQEKLTQYMPNSYRSDPYRSDPYRSDPYKSDPYKSDPYRFDSLTETNTDTNREKNVNIDDNIISNLVLGDIVLAKNYIENEAKQQNKSFDDHLTHMIIHSLLHLFGYDHIENEQAEFMENIEIQILQTMNINNPYK